MSAESQHPHNPYAPQGTPPQQTQGYAQPGYAPQGFAPQSYGQQPYYGQQQPQHYGQQQQQQPYAYASPKMPGIVVGASILWIIYGSLALIGNLITLGGSGGRVGTPGFVGLGIGVAFLVAGIQTLMGKAKGLLANGIVSIVLGSLTAVAFLLLGALIRGFRAPGALLAVGALVGGILITAGILACVGNRKYKEWRAAKGL